MKSIILLLSFMLFFSISFAQTKKSNDTYLKLSAGQVFFGTGDFAGYSILFETSKNVIKTFVCVKQTFIRRRIYF